MPPMLPQASVAIGPPTRGSDRLIKGRLSISDQQRQIEGWMRVDMAYSPYRQLRPVYELGRPKPHRLQGDVHGAWGGRSFQLSIA
jgi:hypothetical protein